MTKTLTFTDVKPGIVINYDVLFVIRPIMKRNLNLN